MSISTLAKTHPLCYIRRVGEVKTLTIKTNSKGSKEHNTVELRVTPEGNNRPGIRAKWLEGTAYDALESVNNTGESGLIH